MLSTLYGMSWGGGKVEIPSLPHSPLAHPPVPEGVACGSDALTLLENTETRSQFIDELMEVRTTRQPRGRGRPAAVPPQG